MAFLSAERVAATSAVKTADDLTIPNNASQVVLQSDTQDVRYTMDGSTVPTQTSGMILIVGEQPEDFLINDLYKIQFTRGAGSDGYLNLHYYAGRDV